MNVADDVEGGGTAVVDDSTEQLTALQQQIDALKAEKTAADQRAREHEESARYWHDKAKTGGEPAAKPAAKTDEEEEIDPIELLSKKGAAGLDELLTKRGWAKNDAVSATVEQARQQLIVEAQLAKDFPDITKPDSEFFKATSAEYAALTKSGMSANAAMVQAAKNVKLSMIDAGKWETPKQKEEREERAAAAGGDRSRKTGGARTTDDDDKLTPFQETIIEQMCPEDMKPEDFRRNYILRANKGVNYRIR